MTCRLACKVVISAFALSRSLYAYAESDRVQQPVAAEACRQDAAALPGYLLRNDAGISQTPESVKAAFTYAASELVQRADKATSNAECGEIIQEFLSSLRKSHLGLETLSSASLREFPWNQEGEDGSPGWRVLSKATAYLRLPSFDGKHQKNVAEAVDDIVRNRRIVNLVIDVRGNGGGSDAAWQPLLPIIAGHPLMFHGVEFLATPENVSATQLAATRFAADPVTSGQLKILAEGMKSVSAGTFSAIPPSPERFTMWKPPASRVLRIAALVDQGCGSSCEEFVLIVKKSWSAKTFGQRTTGSLDFSNLRPWVMPSGLRVVWYATSRSRRLPDNPIDGTGITPDFPMPVPTTTAEWVNAIEFARRILEDGPKPSK
jgi:Peptidase family S41